MKQEKGVLIADVTYGSTEFLSGDTKFGDQEHVTGLVMRTFTIPLDEGRKEF